VLKLQTFSPSLSSRHQLDEPGFRRLDLSSITLSTSNPRSDLPLYLLSRCEGRPHDALGSRRQACDCWRCSFEPLHVKYSFHRRYASDSPFDLTSFLCCSRRPHKFLSHLFLSFANYRFLAPTSSTSILKSFLRYSLASLSRRSITWNAVIIGSNATNDDGVPNLPIHAG
jgi:hypothetical protein